ncbi:MAG: CCP domain-containing protein, partial [Myxococcales bacterium]|nr:CCP domain-containing protein [Myxococcales bacterium]
MQNPRGPDSGYLGDLLAANLTLNEQQQPVTFGGVMEYAVTTNGGALNYDNSMHTKLLLAVPFLERLKILDPASIVDAEPAATYGQWAERIRDFLYPGLIDGYEFYQPGSTWYPDGAGWSLALDTYVYEDTMAYAIRSLHQDMLLRGDDTKLDTIRTAYETYNACSHGNPDYQPEIAWTGYLMPGESPCSTASDVDSGKLYYDLSGAGILGAFRLAEYPADAQVSYAALTEHPVQSFYWATGFDWQMSIDSQSLTVDPDIWRWQDSNAIANLLDFVGAVCPEGFVDTGSGCEAIDCGPLADPEGGRVVVDSGNFAGLARYSCEPGFEMAGDATRSCGEDGQWTGAAPSCSPCSLGTNWELVAEISEASGYAHFDGRFAQDPLTQDIWYGYTRFDIANWPASEVVFMRYDGLDFIEEELVSFAGEAVLRGLEFDAVGGLWAALGDDGKSYLHTRSAGGQWSTIDFDALEFQAPFTSEARALAVDGRRIWVAADACQGTSGAGEDNRAHLILWRYDILDETLTREDLPMVMTGAMNDGTPLGAAIEGQVHCERTFISRIVPHDGEVWIFGGMDSWGSVAADIRSEAFIYAGGDSPLEKILAHRPGGAYRSWAKFNDAVFGPEGELALGLDIVPGAGQARDWQLLEVPVAALAVEIITVVDNYALDPALMSIT